MLSVFQVINSFSQKEPELRFHKISDELLQGAEIEKFFVTKDGCLWFGTNQGLASFDGSEMVYYGSKGLDGTINYRVGDICEDSIGNLWIITPEYGLAYFNRKTGLFKKIEISINEQIKSSQIGFLKIYIDRQGLIWIGSWNRGFFTFDPETNICKHYHLNPGKPMDWESRYENSVRNFLQDRKDDNTIWLAGYGSGIYSFNKQTKQLSKNFRYYDRKDSIWQSNCITGLYQLNDSTLWFHTWSCGMGEYNINSGLYHSYQRNSDFRVDEYPHGHMLEYAVQKSDSEFYVAPRDTIPAVFNINTKRYSYINDEELDKELQRTQNVKLGFNNEVYYEKGGALFISSPRFNLFHNIKVDNKKKFVYPGMRCIFWDVNQHTYYAGIQHGEGVYLYDADLHLRQKINMPPYTGDGINKSTSIWKLYRDKTGYLWALGDITSIYDSASLSFIPVAQKWPQLKLLDSAMYDVAEDNSGLLYFSSPNNEFIVFNPFTLEGKKLLLPETGKTGSLPFYNSLVLSDTLRKYIYFSNNKSLYQYNITNKTFRKLYIDPSYYNNPIEKYDCSYMLDKQGFVWISTPDHYLWKISPDNFKIIDTVKFNNAHIDLNGARLYGAYHEYLLISTFKSQLLFNTLNYQCIYLNRNNGLLLNQGIKEMLCNNNIFFSYSGAGITQYAPITALLQQPKKLIPYISFILINNKPVILDTLPQYLKKLQLDYKHNTISIGFSSIETEFPDRLEYAYKLSKTDEDWIYTNNVNRRINYANLSPGRYVFNVKVREWGSNWSTETNLLIIITPPFWQTWWFIILCILLLAILSYWLIQRRIETIRKREKLRVGHEKELLELEAKALRAQMNPHFIFNCMNSIKSLIQKNDQEKAITYLTTFSKLIRTIFQNSDKREISLYDEIETCRLYTQLESMRFGNKFNYHFNVDKTIDLKSVKVPALIIQPFIENAIWHGIMSKEDGGIVTVTVNKVDHNILCIIDDTGVGREVSKKNKFMDETSSYQSKGVHLTQSRLNLDNLLNERNASIETVDKKDSNGMPTGTTVIVRIQEY